MFFFSHSLDTLKTVRFQDFGPNKQPYTQYLFKRFIARTTEAACGDDEMTRASTGGGGDQHLHIQNHRLAEFLTAGGKYCRM